MLPSFVLQNKIRLKNWAVQVSVDYLLNRTDKREMNR